MGGKKVKHISKKKVSLFYDQFLAGYTEEEWKENSRIRLATFLGKKCRMVLDAGCGTGSLVYLFTKAVLGVTIIGVDISKKSCEIGHNRTQNKKVHFLVADLAHLPFRDSLFDLIIFSEVLEHIFVYEREKVLCELRRIIKPYGHLLLTTPNGLHPVILLRILLNWVSKGCINLSNQIYDHPLSLYSLLQLLKTSGWTVSTICFGNYTPLTRFKIKVPNSRFFASQILVIAQAHN